MTTTRRSRTSAAAARERMLDAGLSLLAAEGLGTGVAHLTIERAIVAAGVARSSGYHAWTGHHVGATPQDAFQRELIRRAISSSAGDKSLDTLGTEVVSVLAALEGASPKRIRDELIRVAGNAHYATCLADRTLAISLALLATSTTAGNDALATEVLTWMREAEDRWRATLADDVFAPFTRFLGLVPRADLVDDLFWDRFVTAVNAVGAGLLPRVAIVDPAILDGIVVRDPDGGEREWSLFAVALDALIERFFEPATAGV